MSHFVSRDTDGGGKKKEEKKKIIIINALFNKQVTGSQTYRTITMIYWHKVKVDQQHSNLMVGLDVVSALVIFLFCTIK